MTTHTIDWKGELRKLAPYLTGSGGVVRLMYDGVDCAIRQFNASLKENYHRGGAARLSVRISREWFTTHLLTDVLAEFAKKLRAAGYPPVLPDSHAAAKILTGNTFEAEAHLSLSNVHVGGDSPSDFVSDRQLAVAAIVNALGNFLAAGGRMMIVVLHSHPTEQNHFWRNFWREGLSELVHSGLFLVHCVDRTDGKGLHHDAPSPTLEIVLPTNFEDDRREADAYDDLYDLFSSLGLSGEGAAVAAGVHLASNMKSVADLHNNLFAAILRAQAAKARTTA